MVTELEVMKGDTVWVLLENDKIVPAIFIEYTWQYDIEGWDEELIRVKMDGERAFINPFSVFCTKGRAKWWREYWG